MFARLGLVSLRVEVANDANLAKRSDERVWHEDHASGLLDVRTMTPST